MIRFPPSPEPAKQSHSSQKSSQLLIRAVPVSAFGFHGRRKQVPDLSRGVQFLPKLVPVSTKVVLVLRKAVPGSAKQGPVLPGLVPILAKRSTLSAGGVPVLRRAVTVFAICSNFPAKAGHDLPPIRSKTRRGELGLSPRLPVKPLNQRKNT